MKLGEMIEIRDNRHNLVSFLFVADEVEISRIIDRPIAKLNWVDTCNLVIEAYQNRLITNVQASACFCILARSNNQFKRERFRYEYGSVYEYCREQQAYVFTQKMPRLAFNTMVNRLGRFL